MAPTIAEALQSILIQPEVLEVIVVDDKSTDNTRSVIEAIKDSRIIVIEGEGRGIARALNRAIDRAGGEFVARCDADDRYTPGRLAWQTTFLNTHADYVAVSGGFCSISERGQMVAKLACKGGPRDITDSLLDGKSITTLCAFLIRRTQLLKLGGAREWFTTAEDLDMMFRLAAVGRVWHEPRVCYDYRLHNASIVHTQSNVQRLFFEESAVRFAVERRDRRSDAVERGEPPRVPDDIGKVSKAGPQIASHLEAEAWSAFRDGRRRDALRLIARSLRSAPLRLSAWRSIVRLSVRALQ